MDAVHVSSYMTACKLLEPFVDTDHGMQDSHVSPAEPETETCTGLT